MHPRSLLGGRGGGASRLRASGGAWALMLAWAAVMWAGGAEARDSLSELESTREWGRLITLWNVMIDHAQHRVYQPGGFRELVRDVDEAASGLEGLAERRVLSREVARELASITRERYQYILEGNYTTRQDVRLSRLEATSDVAHWVVETALAVRRQAAGEHDLKGELAEGAKGNLAFELTFLYHYREFQAGVQERRARLAKREEGGKQVDWEAFEQECGRRQAALLDAYEKRRLPHVRAVSSALPYVLALTEARPEAKAASDAPGERGR